MTIDLPDERDCFQFIRRRRFGDGLYCVHCDASADRIVKRGKTGKGAQRYHCRACETTFSDLTGTILANHRLDLGEVFYILRYESDLSAAQLARDLDRSYKTVLNVVHEIDEASAEERVLYHPIMGDHGAYWGPLPHRTP